MNYCELSDRQPVAAHPVTGYPGCHLGDYPYYRWGDCPDSHLDDHPCYRWDGYPYCHWHGYLLCYRGGCRDVLQMRPHGCRRDGPFYWRLGDDFESWHCGADQKHFLYDGHCHRRDRSEWALP